jgi:hypothetical protein
MFCERRRQGETISTAFVESTINQVVSRRFVKKQQMQWTLRGAHLFGALEIEKKRCRQWLKMGIPLQIRQQPPICVSCHGCACQRHCFPNTRDQFLIGDASPEPQSGTEEFFWAVQCKAKSRGSTTFRGIFSVLKT